MRSFFISGMFRSGTTTIARALNAHPLISCASDPIGGLFKSFRSDMATLVGHHVSPSSPLGNYYFDADGQALLNHMMNKSSLDTPIKALSENELLSLVEKSCDSYSGWLLPHLSKLQWDTYKSVLDSFLGITSEAYGNLQTKLVGFKEVWTNEFVPVLARSYPEMKFIFVTRDPRSVCASKKMQAEKYPWTFLAIQWRKLAAIQTIISSDEILSSRVFNLRLEDFLLEPVDTMRRLTDFLEIDWHPDVADPSKYRDGNGEPWQQNSSFGSHGQAIDLSAIDRWKDVLTVSELALVEKICGPEMSMFGYENALGKGDLESHDLILNPPMIADEELAGWMRGKVQNSIGTIASQIATDSIRERILSLTHEQRNSVPDELVQHAFLARRILDRIE